MSKYPSLRIANIDILGTSFAPGQSILGYLEFEGEEQVNIDSKKAFKLPKMASFCQGHRIDTIDLPQSFFGEWELSGVYYAAIDCRFSGKLQSVNAITESFPTNNKYPSTRIPNKDAMVNARQILINCLLFLESKFFF